jgi:hypothetical protein
MTDDLKATNLFDFTRMLLEVARNVDESDPVALRDARKRLIEIKEANPELAEELLELDTHRSRSSAKGTDDE